MSERREAWCAHTMIAKNGELLICCDCGRHFRDKQHIEKVQDHEAETGFVMTETPSYCGCMNGPNDPDPKCPICKGIGYSPTTL